MFRSEQERIIFALSQALLGSQWLFKPLDYRSGTKEPADMVWVAQRCALIVNMTSGNKSFDKKRAHNFNQLRTWIRHWKGGEVLRGQVAGETREFRYDDVDYIIGLSVVGGADVGCISEDEIVKCGDGKLAICATISDDVFRKLASDVISIRDVLVFLAILREQRQRISQEAAIAIVSVWFAQSAQETKQIFADILPSPIDINDAWRQTKALITAIKSEGQQGWAGDMMSDLGVADAIWLCIAERALARQIAPPAGHGPVLIGKGRSSGIYGIGCFVFANMEIMANKISDLMPLLEQGRAGFILCSTLDFGVESPVRVLVSSETQPDERHTTKIVRELRGRILSGTFFPKPEAPL